MRHFFNKIYAFTLLAILFSLLSTPTTWAFLPVDHKVTSKIFQEAGIKTTPPADENGKIDGVQIVRQLLMNGLGYGKIIIGTVGVLYLTIMGFRLVLDSEREETISDVKRGTIFMIIAFAIISMSQDLAKIADFSEKSPIDTPQEILRRVQLFDLQVNVVMVFVKYTLGAFATLMIVRSAISLISAGGNSEETDKHTKSILYSAGGLVLIFVGEVFIKRVFFVVDKNQYLTGQGVQVGIDAFEGVKEIIGITNFVVSFSGVVAVLMLIVAGAMYAGAGSNEELTGQAKRIVLAVVVGMAIIYGAFAIVSSVIYGRLYTIEKTASLFSQLS